MAVDENTAQPVQRRKKRAKHTDPRMERFAVRVTGRKVRRQHMLLRLGAIVGLIVICLLALAYAASSLVENAGKFIINVAQDSSKMLSICAEPTFERPTLELIADPIKNADNITESWIGPDAQDVDGSNNGQNYICYSYYVKNMGEETMDYTASISLLSSTLNADEAVRVKVFYNGESQLYAKSQLDSEEPEPGTIAFLSDVEVMRMDISDFAPGDVQRFTVMIWLEGEDPQCVDDIRGGGVSMAMKLAVNDDQSEAS